MTATGQDELGLTFQSFVEWAREQGWRYAMAPAYLSHFERFLKRRGVERLGDVDTELVCEYQRCLSTQGSAATVCGYFSTLRALWRYLLREELVTDDPVKGVTPPRPDYFIPYLYTAHELLCVERAARTAVEQTFTPRRRFCRQTRQTAFGLLRDCGLRVSEACRLNLDNYDPRARSLRIEETKFFKTRLIPLPRTTSVLLEQYLEHRLRESVGAGELALFISIYGRRLDRRSLEASFKQMLCKLGLYQRRRRQGRTVFGSTNLHALRHSFAVRTLTRWQQQGRDVERLLPLLSGYMGHVKVAYTTHYLHLTPTLRQLASERFGEKVLPWLDHRGTVIDDEQEG
jgi:integrase/recombinase XerD